MKLSEYEKFENLVKIKMNIKDSPVDLIENCERSFSSLGIKNLPKIMKRNLKLKKLLVENIQSHNKLTISK